MACQEQTPGALAEPSAVAAATELEKPAVVTTGAAYQDGSQAKANAASVVAAVMAAASVPSQTAAAAQAAVAQAAEQRPHRCSL